MVLILPLSGMPETPNGLPTAGFVAFGAVAFRGYEAVVVFSGCVAALLL